MTKWSVVIGTARAPKATGAVSATSAMTAALTGSNPIATSIALQIAIGTPKPASASINAPKQKATMIAWMRKSALIRQKLSRSTAKCPVSTVML